VSWRDHAACAGVDPELFFPDSGQRTKAAQAKAICRRCPVQDHCAEFALKVVPPIGIWGGMTVPERRRLARVKGVLRERRR
jgi:WhiB family transcriptional regulator, redox-sensing transcriptional regulator